MSQIAHVRVRMQRVTWELIRKRLGYPGIYFINTQIGGQDKKSKTQREKGENEGDPVRPKKFIKEKKFE